MPGVEQDTGLAVVIPVLDEVVHLPRLLAELVPQAGQVVVVDGGSRDGSVAAARAVAGVEVVAGTPPRGAQLNQGAARARGDVILFLHADARLPASFPRLVRDALADSRVVGGAFALALDDPRLRARVVSRGANLRTFCTGHPYGDQAIFVRRDTFLAMGGFATPALMEDLDFSWRLRRRGRLRLLRQPVTVSARRWRSQGYMRTTGRNAMLAACFYLGLDVTRWRHWLAPQRGR